MSSYAVAWKVAACCSDATRGESMVTYITTTECTAAVLYYHAQYLLMTNNPLFVLRYPTGSPRTVLHVFGTSYRQII